MIEAVIFDLDGVIVTTDEYHYQAWNRLAQEESFVFSREHNELFRGVSRKECLEIFIRNSDTISSAIEKEELLERKNGYYREMLKNLHPEDIFPEIEAVIMWLKERKIKVAIGSSSRNTPIILEKIGLSDEFDAVVDGNQISHSKPDPEVFLRGAGILGVVPEKCLVIEDAAAGVEAAHSGGMKVIGVGSAFDHQKADYGIRSLTLEFIQHIISRIMQ
jgi:beta-phosphoglucomutase